MPKRLTHEQQRELMVEAERLLNDNREMAAYIDVLETALKEAFKVANRCEETLRFLIDPSSTKVAGDLRGLAVVLLPLVQSVEELQAQKESEEAQSKAAAAGEQPPAEPAKEATDASGG